MTAIPSTLWVPTPKQGLFLSCPYREAMFGGAKGGGKSDVLIMDHIEQHSIVHERWQRDGQKTKGRAVLFRRSMNELEDIMPRAHSRLEVLYPAMANGWLEQKKTFHCPCGYRFQFAHLEDPGAHRAWNGQELSWIGYDQVEEIPENQYRFINLNLRCSSADMVLYPYLRIRCSANPLGRHVGWVKKRFIDPHPDGMKVIANEVDTTSGKVTRERIFIPARHWENPHLSPDYEATLMEGAEHEQRAYIHGEWDVIAGAFFADVFIMNVHVVDPFEIPKHWEVFRAADWGSRAPACCLWIAIDTESNLIVVEELYEPGQTGSYFGKKIIEVEEAWGWTDTKGYSKLHGYIDHQGRQQYGSEGPTPVETMMEMGISWFDASKERKPGWVEVRRRLMERGGPQGRTPGLRIFRNCRNLIRTLPNLIAKEEDHDDIDSKQEDHAADALRYGCMSRPMSAHATKDDREIEQWERIMHARQAQQGITQRSKTTGY